MLHVNSVVKIQTTEILKHASGYVLIKHVFYIPVWDWLKQFKCKKKQQRSGDSVYTTILGRNQAWKLDCWIPRYVINDAAQDQKCQMK